MPSASTTNQLADIATYMWSVNLLQRAAFNGGSIGINEGRDIVLLVENAALSYGIEQSLDGVEGVALDVYRLVGQMLQPANEVLSSGSGGVVPSPTPPGSGNLIPYIINIIVSSGQAGSNTLQSGTDWVGLVDLNPTITINNSQFQLNSDYTYNSVTGVFDFSLCSYIFQTGDKFSTSGFMPTN